ncbi:hypothetical protein B0H14DRAFT_2618833, partial [Mycena olivaceomarginata]
MIKPVLRLRDRPTKDRGERDSTKSSPSPRPGGLALIMGPTANVRKRGSTEGWQRLVTGGGISQILSRWRFRASAPINPNPELMVRVASREFGRMIDAGPTPKSEHACIVPKELALNVQKLENQEERENLHLQVPVVTPLFLQNLVDMPTAVPGAEAPHRRTRTPHALEASLLENQISAPRRRTRPLLALEASLLENRTSRRSNFRAESRQARAPVPFSRPVPAVAAMARHGDPGWRSDRITPLMHEDLWQGGHGPPVQFPARAHHKCSICQHVKSHPVSYLCGHSHCYVCIRLWLERSWSCPECITTMFQPPFR